MSVSLSAKCQSSCGKHQDREHEVVPGRTASRIAVFSDFVAIVHVMDPNDSHRDRDEVRARVAPVAGVQCSLHGAHVAVGEGGAPGWAG